MKASTLTPVTAAELVQQIQLLERQLEVERTRAVNAARMNDGEVETAALHEIELVEGRLRARRQALDQARLDEAAAATKARDAAIEHVVATVLPRLEDEVATALRNATRDRTAAAVQALDLACRHVSALRSRLLELTGEQRRFHPSLAPHPSTLLRDDASLESLWRRVRERAPIDTTGIYAGLPPA